MIDDTEEARQAAESFQALVNEARDTFFASMQERHRMGEAKYGPIKFMEVNTLEQAAEEIVDLANYALYTYVKLYVLNKQIQRVVGDQPEALGGAGFIPSGGKS